jgi:hypothetical protein
MCASLQLLDFRAGISAIKKSPGRLTGAFLISNRRFTPLVHPKLPWRT